MTFIKMVAVLMALLLALLLLAACDAGTTGVTESEPAAEAVVSDAITEPTVSGEGLAEPVQVTAIPSTDVAPDIATSVATESVVVEAADGLAVQGTLYAPADDQPHPGVILLHMLGSSREAWVDSGLTIMLAENGYTVLAVDMRGHGETGSDQDWEQTPGDIERVWTYFTERPEMDAERTAIVGASIGANLALITAANEPAINTVVLLSPGLDYQGLTTNDAVVAYGERPILLVASQEDTYAADSVRRLEELAQGEAQLEVYSEAGHGTAMLDRQPALAEVILAWLNQHLK